MPKAKWKNFTDEELIQFVNQSISFSEVAKKLGYTSGSGINTIKKILTEKNIDTSHFKGQAWNRNDEELSWGTIKKQFLQTKPYKCECCGISSWNGKDLSLTVHHKDGDHCNNDFSNLQILCPNCHSQTENFCSKNRTKYNSITDEMFLNAIKTTPSINRACQILGIPANQAAYIRAKRLIDNDEEAK